MEERRTHFGGWREEQKEEKDYEVSGEDNTETGK